MTYLPIGDVDAQVNVPEAATADFSHQPVFSPNHELPTPDYPRRHGWQSFGLPAAAPHRLIGGRGGRGEREERREKKGPSASSVRGTH